MIDDGVVEAIVGLPAQLFTSTGVPVTVWLLTYPKKQRRDELLLVDASDLGHMISRTQRILSREDRSRIVDTVVSWRAGTAYADVPGFAASVAVQRIREQDHVLVPARYVGTSVRPDTQLASVDQLWDDLARLDRRAAQVDEDASRQLHRIQPWIR